MNEIEFAFNGDKVIIWPSLYTCILHVGDYFTGSFSYTPSKFRIDPPRKLSKELILEIDRVMEKWHEERTNIALHAHISSTNRVKEIYKDTRLPESKD